MALPYFSALVDRQFAIDYRDPSTVILLPALIAAVGGLGGLYPAMTLARSRSERVLKREASAAIGHSGSAGNMLLGFQFAIAITLMIATLVMYFQLSFYKNRNHGFNGDNLLEVEFSGPLNPQTYSRKSVLLDEVKQLPGVLGASLSMRQANEGSQGTPVAGIARSELEGSDVSARMLFVGYDFFNVYEIPLRREGATIHYSTSPRKAARTRWSSTAWRLEH